MKETKAARNIRQKVLIVDDSEMNRIILHEMLCETFDILEATNGQEGLDVLEQEGRQISLVLLDIVMPVMDGFGVLKRMKEKRIIEEIPVIMISAEVSIPTIRQAYEMGVADYISRPFDAQIVCNRVFNTIKLYAKQRRLMKILTDQAKEKERGQKIMVDILSQIVEFRNGESAPHVHHIGILDPDVAGTIGTADRTVSDFPDAKRSGSVGHRPCMILEKSEFQRRS